MSAILALIHQNPVIFGAIVGVLGVVLFYLYQAASAEKPEEVDHTVDSKTVYTRKEIAKHNKPDDLWCIVCDRVYNITRFVPFHPGGDLLFKHAGGDATLGFFGIQHPTRVFNEIHDYQVGVLSEKEHAKWALSAAEIAKHNKKDDLWVCIEERVYDFSKWMNEHPGGADVLLQHAGLDKRDAATAKFEKVHKKETKELLHQYFIGYIDAKPTGRMQDYYVAQEKMADTPKEEQTKKQAPKNLGEYTVADVAKHNTEKNGWVIVDKKVYDVSEFVDSHPGGAEILAKELGKDVSKLFESVPHPPYVRTEVLQQYLIGEVKQ